ncbi:DUF6641 family protein [Salinarimonas sp.]|uniref:DUF6641 family protein n=1 Tax=Salinarimonas sp. TaxID=2766526 RepID=UPI0032D99BAA
MAGFKDLKLVAYERPNNGDPIHKRRRKLLDQLAEQMRLAEDAGYQPTADKWVEGEGGVRQRVQVPKRVKRWWGKDARGNTVLTIRYGSKPMELAKGKHAIMLTGEADVVPTLQAIVAAVETGEMDAAIEAAANAPKLKRKAS